MKRAPKKLLKELGAWVDRSKEPEDSGDPGYEAYWDATTELWTLYGEKDFGGGIGKLTDAQRRVGALLSVANAVPCDGLVTGVVVNEGDKVKHAIEAAKALGLKDVTRALDKLVSLVPKVLWTKDADARWDWSQNNDKAVEKIAELEETDLFEDARQSMMRAAIALALEHPDEFFK